LQHASKRLEKGPSSTALFFILRPVFVMAQIINKQSKHVPPAPVFTEVPLRVRTWERQERTTPTASIAAAVFAALAVAIPTLVTSLSPFPCLGQSQLFAGNCCSRGWKAADKIRRPIVGKIDLYASIGAAYHYSA
jgi:hypothetical protein